MSAFTLLVVDDEPDVVDALRRALRDPRYEVLGCTAPLEALALLANRRVDLVISDLDMPVVHGLELLRRVRREHPDAARIVLTGRASLDSALEAINEGEVHRYLTKPWEKATLRRVVDETLDRLAELRRSSEAERRAAAREELTRQLERGYPGIAEIALEDGAVRLDPARLDALWLPPEPRAERAPDFELEGLRGLVLDGRFRLEEPIGKGGFGVVYRAVQLSLERFVAVKLLRQGRDELKRFRLEALSSCRVVHPNAVTVLDAGVSEQGFAYLVMELLDGETVSKRLRRGESLPFDAAAALAADVCAALAVAHGSGIVHRDVKPGNVFLHRGPEGPITKLLDFGIARLVSQRATFRGLTSDGHLVGTPAYIAPERAAGRESDGRADVYSVGVLLYEVLSGTRPLDAACPNELTRQLLSVHPRPLAALDPRVPTALDAFVARMLEKEPERRPTAAEAAAGLRALVPNLPAERMLHTPSAAAELTTRRAR